MHLKGIVIPPPPPVSIADKDNDCEVSEPSNVRQSLSSGSLLQRTWKEDQIHNNAAAASPIMMILHNSCHFFKGEAYSWQSIVCIYIGNRKIFTITLLCKTGNYGCNDPCSLQQGNSQRSRIGIKFIRRGCAVPAQLNMLMHFTMQCLCNFTTEY